jgi:hypothetical protein
LKSLIVEVHDGDHSADDEDGSCAYSLPASKPNTTVGKTGHKKAAAGKLLLYTAIFKPVVLELFTPQTP